MRVEAIARRNRGDPALLVEHDPALRQVKLKRVTDGTTIDNIEDLDTMVGYLAEPTRPHGYAISETQFVVFILKS